MRAFLTRRLLLLVPTLLGVTLATFLMLHLTPGDPVTIMLGEFASASDVARLRAELGLDRPIVVQYLKFLGRAVRGDLGSSIRSRRPVQEEIAERLPPTMVLALAAQVLAVCAGITAGVTAAAARRPSVDSAIVAVTLVGLSMPTFWSGLLLILLFSLTLGWRPITASGGLRALILPAVTLAAPAAAVLARVTRASVLEVLRQDYVRTARAKGVSERLVVYRHALRNALIPVLTVAALQFAGLAAGAVIVESVLSRPGLGRRAVTALLSRGCALAQGVVLRPPSRSFPLGTDELGRDVLSRVIHGARISLRIGIVTIGIALVLGTVIGVLAGFYGGVIDGVLMAVMEVLLAFPQILLAMAILAMLGPSLTNAMIAVGLSAVPVYARTARGTTLSVRAMDYVEAARAIGVGDGRILARHVLPNMISPVVVLATAGVGIAILIAAGLSYLGLGAQPPTPEWGAMLSQARAYLRNAWWMATFPGLAITLVVISLNLCGDWLRDLLDPRLRT